MCAILGALLAWVLVAPVVTAPQARPTATMAGTVLDSAGRPVPHAAIALLTGTGEVPGDERLHGVHAVSEADGRFAIPNVPIGAYKIVVASADELREWPGPNVVARHAGRAFPFDLHAAGSTLRLTVIVGPEPARSISIESVMFTRVETMGGPDGPPPGAPRRPGAPNLPPGLGMSGPGIISGIVTDADGRPVAGIHVQAGRWQDASAGATGRLLPTGLPVETDANGVYRVAGLSPGRYMVAALAWRFDVSMLTEGSARSHPAFADANGHAVAFQTTYHPDATDAARGTVLNVESGEIADIAIRIQTGAVATFTARLGQANPSRRTSATARLIPLSVLNQFSERNVVRSLPDADGLTTFRDVGLGTYTLSYYSPDGWLSERVEVTGARGEVLAFPLRPTMTVSGVVDLKPTRVVPGPDALSGMTVTMTLGPATSGPVLRSSVAPDGSFTITGIPGGQYTLTLAAGSSWIPVASILSGQDSLDRPIDMVTSISGARLIVTDRQTTVQGQVTGADGARVTAGSVVVYSSDRRHWTAGATRRVRVAPIVPGGGYNVNGLPPGSYFVAAFAPGVRITNTALAAASEGATAFELALGELKVVPAVLRR